MFRGRASLVLLRVRSVAMPWFFVIVAIRLICECLMVLMANRVVMQAILMLVILWLSVCHLVVCLSWCMVEQIVLFE